MEGVSAASLPAYRLYFFEYSSKGREMRQRIELTCEDDDAAVREALRRGDGRMMELWRTGGQFVKGWPAKRR